MARIDVSELLVDPDFTDAVTVLRYGEAVNDYGEAVRTVASFDIVASVQAASSDDLKLLPDAARAAGVVEVITQTALVVATDTTAADVVLWRGRRWMISKVDAFGNFATGAGHYECLATLVDLAHASPQ